MERAVEEYNNSLSFSLTNKKNLNLTMFIDACLTVTKILRILQFQSGHALILGTSGMGRNSLGRLAIFMADLKFYECGAGSEYSIKIWNEEFKKCLLYW